MIYEGRGVNLLPYIKNFAGAMTAPKSATARRIPPARGQPNTHALKKKKNDELEPRAKRPSSLDIIMFTKAIYNTVGIWKLFLDCMGTVANEVSDQALQYRYEIDKLSLWTWAIFSDVDDATDDLPSFSYYFRQGPRREELFDVWKLSPKMRRCITHSSCYSRFKYILGAKRSYRIHTLSKRSPIIVEYRPAISRYS